MFVPEIFQRLQRNCIQCCCCLLLTFVFLLSSWELWMTEPFQDVSFMLQFVTHAALFKSPQPLATQFHSVCTSSQRVRRIIPHQLPESRTDLWNPPTGSWCTSAVLWNHVQHRVAFVTEDFSLCGAECADGNRSNIVIQTLTHYMLPWIQQQIHLDAAYKIVDVFSWVWFATTW